MIVNKYLLEKAYSTLIYQKNDVTITIKDIISLLHRNNIQCYVTGGAVREWVMNTTPSDIDITVKASIPEVIDIITKSYPASEFLLYRLDSFGIAVVGDPKIYHLDINMFRKPQDYEKGDFSVGDSISDDSKTKDFTINSLYLDCISNEILDPSGLGLQDVKDNRLQINASKTVFTSNPKSSLRIIKFILKGYNPTKETMSYLKHHLDKDLIKLEKKGIDEFVTYQILDKKMPLLDFKKTLYQHAVDEKAVKILDETFGNQ